MSILWWSADLITACSVVWMHQLGAILRFLSFVFSLS